MPNFKTPDLNLVLAVIEMRRCKESKAPGDEKGLDEIDDTVDAAVLPLAVGKDPVETLSFRGLGGVIFRASVAKGAGDLIAIPALAEQSRERLDLTFGECRDGAHGG